MLNEFLALADDWISERADEPGVTWFRGAVREVANARNERQLGVAIGMAPRRLGKPCVGRCRRKSGLAPEPGLAA